MKSLFSVLILLACGGAIVFGITLLSSGNTVIGIVCLLIGVFILSSFMYYLYRTSRSYFEAILSIILLFYVASGYGLSVVGILNFLSVLGIVETYSSVTSPRSMEVNGDITTGWICLSIGIFVILSAMAIKRKYNIKLL